jgi:hypothetical protein
MNWPASPLFIRKSYGEYEGKSYQLRGMATTGKYRGQGFGNHAGELCYCLPARAKSQLRVV